MKSIRQVYKIGNGPSSSHTMGPKRAAQIFAKTHPEALSYEVTLYGSLAASGKGHLTDEVIIEALSPKPTNIIFNNTLMDIPHPNTMDIKAFFPNGKTVVSRIYSIGGGDIEIEGGQISESEATDTYPKRTFAQIKAYCKENSLKLSDYALQYEDDKILEFLTEVWETMKRSIAEGLEAQGILPGGLDVVRKAKYLYNYKDEGENSAMREKRIVYAYAFAVSEQNASAGVIVTAPTCGAGGLLPAVLKYAQEKNNLSDSQIVKALATAGVIGSFIKENASVSGAECGCQAEIGSACCMASAALAELEGMSIDQVEYAAEVAMEHNLGLTCDPIHGLVQIPCIERNAVCAMRAIDTVCLAKYITHTHKISFDTVVETMYKTGKDLSRLYRETSEGGLAAVYGK
ncbi:MAG: L-serine ammonia-lyase [Eubacteriaceae bacterium]|nr:L-serine ammonia-lyase [Eubacteriaceae bacterium]